MFLVFVLDVFVLFPLAWVFYVLWSDRINFRSFVPIIASVAFLFCARLCEVLVEYPTIYNAGLLRFSREDFSLVVVIVGGFADVLGVLFLVTGFLRAIKTQQTQEGIIIDLEALLPICAYCKKYRSEDGVWHPIEKYLHDMGAPKMTHDMCPECAIKMEEEIKKLKR
jgi:hypothetical protein